MIRRRWRRDSPRPTGACNSSITSRIAGTSTPTTKACSAGPRRDYSLLLSADDLLAPGALRRAVTLLDAHPDTGMAYGMAIVISSSGVLPALRAGDSNSQIVPGSRLIERICARGNGVPTPTALVRTALQKRIGGYRKDLPHSGDMEMWLRFAIGGSIGILGGVQAFYRVHGANMSAQYYQVAIRDRREQLLACQQARDLAQGNIPGFADWVQAMSVRFGAECFWAGSHAFDRGETEMARTCLEQALYFDPTISKSRMWRRYQLKALIGPRLWKRVARLVPGRQSK